MRTLQGMRMRTECMMEAMRRNAIDDTFKKWREAVRSYYTNGYDNGETTKLYKELEMLGANTEVLVEEDLRIRNEICGI